MNRRDLALAAIQDMRADLRTLGPGDEWEDVAALPLDHVAVISSCLASLYDDGWDDLLLMLDLEASRHFTNTPLVLR